MDADFLLIEQFIKKYPVKAAQSIEGLESDEIAAFIEEISIDLSLKLISAMNAYKVAKCLKLIKSSLAVDLLEKMDVQKAELLLRQLDEAYRNEFLERIKPKLSVVLRTKLEFRANSVGALMVPLDFQFQKDMIVKDVIKTLRREKNQRSSIVCIVNGEGAFEGIVRLRDLLIADSTDELSVIMMTELSPVFAELPIEAIRNHAGWNEIRSLPVIDDAQKIIGILNFAAVQKNLAETGHGLTKEVMETSNALGELYRIGLTAFLQSVSK